MSPGLPGNVSGGTVSVNFFKSPNVRFDIEGGAGNDLFVLGDAGDVVADVRGEKLKLQADLKAENVWLDTVVPASGAEAGSWGRAVLPLAMLRAMDAQVSILSRTASFRGYNVGASRFIVSVEQGKLTASGGSRPASWKASPASISRPTAMASAM